MGLQVVQPFLRHWAIGWMGVPGLAKGVGFMARRASRSARVMIFGVMGKRPRS